MLVVDVPRRRTNPLVNSLTDTPHITVDGSLVFAFILLVGYALLARGLLSHMVDALDARLDSLRLGCTPRAGIQNHQQNCQSHYQFLHDSPPPTSVLRPFLPEPESSGHQLTQCILLIHHTGIDQMLQVSPQLAQFLSPTNTHALPCPRAVEPVGPAVTHSLTHSRYLAASKIIHAAQTPVNA
jgi:hypothetical protein